MGSVTVQGSLGSKVGELAQARISPVLGSMAMQKPPSSTSNCSMPFCRMLSQKAWMVESMVRVRLFPSVASK